MANNMETEATMISIGASDPNVSEGGDDGGRFWTTQTPVT